MKPVILVVEDEAALARLIGYNLENEGFEVVETASGEDALLIVRERQSYLMLLDWMLPDVAGIEVCRQLRRKAETANLPIIMLTARGEESDRIRGLDTGADDYIAKPFSHDELAARIRAVLRRIRPAFGEDVLSHQDVSVNTAKHTVVRGTRAVKLGPTEYRLLCYLMEHPGRVFSRGRLLDAVWGPDADIDERTVDVHIRRLRKTLNQGGEVDLIRTVREAGYALGSPEA